MRMRLGLGFRSRQNFRHNRGAGVMRSAPLFQKRALSWRRAATAVSASASASVHEGLPVAVWPCGSGSAQGAVPCSALGWSGPSVPMFVSHR